jgi:hypothetical protein
MFGEAGVPGPLALAVLMKKIVVSVVMVASGCVLPPLSPPIRQTTQAPFPLRNGRVETSSFDISIREL